MSKKSMWNNLKLDSFGIEIPLSQSKSVLIDFLREKGIPLHIPTEAQVVIKSKMFSFDADFLIALHFEGEKLIDITIVPEVMLEGNAMYYRYREIQQVLEHELGRPGNRLRFIFRFFESGLPIIALAAQWHEN